MTQTATALTPGPAPRPDLAALRARAQATWASADFSIIGTTLQLVGETLCAAADVAAGERVLDVCCGNGNAAIAAARRFAEVSGVDFVPALIDHARLRAEADGLQLDLREGDALDLSYADAAFDAVISSFGVMFAVDQERAAAELLRVCRPGGRIALACWTPDGFVGELLRTVGARVPPPVGVKSPLRWGTQDGLAELLGDGCGALRAERRSYVFHYRSAHHFVEVFRRFYGPMHRAFEALPPDGRAGLERDLLALLGRWNASRNGALAVPGDYLEVVAERT